MRLSLFVLTIVILGALWEQMCQAQTSGESYAIDDTGERFRIQFDPGNRIHLASGVGYGPGDLRGDGAGPIVEFFWSFRGNSAESQDDANYWRRNTRLLDSWVWFANPAADGDSAFDFTALSGTYVAYSAEPFIMLPTEPPRRVWFPFNPGISIEAVGLTTTPEREGQWGEINVVDTALILDFLRSERHGTWGWFGVNARYDLRVPTEALDLTSLDSVVTPFTAGALNVHHEWNSGLFEFDTQAQVGRHWSSEGQWSTFAFASVRQQWTPVAVNDRPMSLFFEVVWSHDDVRDDILVDDLLLCGGISIGFDRSPLER